MLLDCPLCNDNHVNFMVKPLLYRRMLPGLQELDGVDAEQLLDEAQIRRIERWAT